MYATFTNDSRASSIFTTEEMAAALAEKQNAKAEVMGIKARYSVGEAEPTASDKPRDSMPSVWL